jgi:hypothetical protein
VADKGAKGPNRKLFVLWDRKIGAAARLNQDQVTPNLAGSLPARLLKGLHCFFTGNVGKFAHQLNSYDNLLATRLFGEL